MTPEEQSKIDAVERDRRKREEEMLWLLLLLLGTATTHAVAAQRLGHDPVDAARTVLLGSAGLELGGLTTPLSRLLATSYTDGIRRTDLLTGTRPPIEPPDESRITAYGPASTNIVNGLAASVGTIIGDAISEGRAAGLGTRKIATSIRTAMKSAGYLGEDPRIPRVVSERAIVDAHGAGMWAGWNRPDQWERISGFYHRSVVDDRTTKICRERDGFTRPKDDSYWRSNFPSLHWNCRSIVFPVFNPRIWSTVYPSTPPMPGFGRAPWLVGAAA